MENDLVNARELEAWYGGGQLVEDRGNSATLMVAGLAMMVVGITGMTLGSIQARALYVSGAPFPTSFWVLIGAAVIVCLIGWRLFDEGFAD